MIEAGTDLNFAIIGNLVMQRGDGEPVPAFRARARATALELGASILVFDLPVLRWVDDPPETDNQEEA